MLIFFRRSLRPRHLCGYFAGKHVTGAVPKQYQRQQLVIIIIVRYMTLQRDFA